MWQGPHKKVPCFSQAPQPEQEVGQSSSEAEGALSRRTPFFLHISLVLEQSPGLSWDGGWFFGNRIHLVQFSLSAEPALGLVLCFSEVTGLFPQASSETVGLRGKSWRANSCLRPPPDTSLRNPSSQEAGPGLHHEMSPDPDLPGPERPLSQGGQPQPHSAVRSHFACQGAHRSPASLYHSHQHARSCSPRRAKGPGARLWRTRNGLDGGQPDWGQQAVQPAGVHVLQVCEDTVEAEPDIPPKAVNF